MEIIGKISLKGIGAQPAANSVTDSHDVAHIYGTARRFLIGTTTYGDYTKFQGDFEAVNTSNGETFRSNSLVLPELVEKMLVAALLAEGAKAGKVKTQNTPEVAGGEAQAPVEFAFAIGVRKTETKEGSVSRGYEYTIRPLIQLKGADPLAHLRDQVKALPAPNAKPAAENKASEKHASKK